MPAHLEIAICSHRLGGTDGVSIEAAKWQAALESLGHDVRTIAGSGLADHIVPELAIDAELPPSEKVLEAAFANADIVIVENICSLKLNPTAAQALAKSLGGRRAILHHHDLTVERLDRAHLGPPADDPSWTHVCISRRAAVDLAAFSISSRLIYNHFDPDPPIGDRIRTRRDLEVVADERLVLQPTRAISRKAVPVGVSLAAALGATYWLLGDAEDGYNDELKRILSAARCRVIWDADRRSSIDIDDAYAACDLVTLPSTWEGFGNPAIESATHRRPLAIGTYPVGAELAAFGFRWFAADDSLPIDSYLLQGDQELIEDNAAIA